MYFVAIILAANPQFATLFDVVDRVEVNSVFNCDGKLVFDQAIWWRWNSDESRFDVADWRILIGVRRRNEAAAIRWAANNFHGPDYLPEFVGGHATPRSEQCGFVSEWLDERHNCWRRVVASECVWTSSNYDREVFERDVLPESKRIRLAPRNR